MEQREFSEYVTSCVSTALRCDPAMDVTTIKIDTKLSTLKLMRRPLAKYTSFLRQRTVRK